MNDYNATDKIKMQIEYARNKKSEVFATNIFCYSCGRNIWERISEEKAKSELITGCPFCNHSFCN